MSETVLGALVFGAMFGLVLNWVVDLWVLWWSETNRAKSGVRLVPYSEERSCDSPHEWKNVDLLFSSIQGPHDVCVNCGSISGFPHGMLNDEALVSIREALERIRTRDEYKEKFERMVDERTRHYIAKYLMEKFPEDIKMDGMIERLSLAMWAFTTLRHDAQTKVIAEEVARLKHEQDYRGEDDAVH